jgi:hypothetical protein
VAQGGWLKGNQLKGADISVVVYFMQRVFLDGFQHAVWTGIAAFSSAWA